MLGNALAFTSVIIYFEQSLSFESLRCESCFFTLLTKNLGQNIICHKKRLPNSLHFLINLHIWAAEGLPPSGIPTPPGDASLAHLLPVSSVNSLRCQLEQFIQQPESR